MKAKKVLAAALAAAMAFSALPGMSAKADVIEGGTVWVEQDVIEVTLPTTASQKFYIDPQGLIALGKGETEATGAGTVIALNKMYAVNNSSVPLAFTVECKLLDSASGSGVTIATGAANAADIQNSTDRKIAVSVSTKRVDSIPSASPAATYNGYVFKADNATASSSAVDLTATSGATTLASPEAVYAVASGSAVDTKTYFMTAQTYKAQAIATGESAAYKPSNYKYVPDTSKQDSSCVELIIGGYCSKKADWSDYAGGTKNLKLDLVFKFKKLTKTDDATPKYYLDSAATEVQTGPKVTISTAGKITITGLDGSLWKSMSLNDGTQDWPLTTGKDGTWVWEDAEDGKKEFTLGSNWVPTYLKGKTVTVTVTLSDNSTIVSPAVTFPN